VIFSIQAQDTTDLQKKINEYQEKLQQLKQQKNTLSSQIQYMDTQIYLTGLQINATEQKIVETEKEINLLGSRIEGLDQSLDYLSKQLIERIVIGYKKKPLSLFSLLLDNNNANDFLNQVKYLKTAQTNNQKLLYTVQETKTNAEEQKKLREEKKIELDKLTETLNYQKQSLDNQKVQKQRLLAETQNSEQVYQGLLSKAQAEYAAIQGIVAGAGTETQIREVKKGDFIATVISGTSCNSSGSHLHFIVQEGGSVQNPFNYLKDVSHVDYTNGDPWSPSGNWDWPISPAIEFNQGYGETWSVRNTWVGNIYRFHNGIDIFGSSYNVYAVADGTLYRGSYAVRCTLSYAKLVHKDSNITTLYLHTYTQ
ncbi:MAG: hypothetical protein AAB569_04400, partial [Patescibacteria group bacterium]